MRREGREGRGGEGRGGKGRGRGGKCSCSLHPGSVGPHDSLACGWSVCVCVDFIM